MASPQLARNLVAWARDTDSTRRQQAGERRGSGTTPCHFGVIAECDADDGFLGLLKMLLETFRRVMAGSAYSRYYAHVLG